MASEQRLETLMDEIARLLALQLRFQMETQTEMIVALGDAGFGPSRIAELLGTTPNTVNVALSKARKARQQPRSGSSSSPDRR